VDFNNSERSYVVFSKRVVTYMGGHEARLRAAQALDREHGGSGVTDRLGRAELTGGPSGRTVDLPADQNRVGSSGSDVLGIGTYASGEERENAPSQSASTLSHSSHSA
jgi:hypothetical protein